MSRLNVLLAAAVLVTASLPAVAASKVAVLDPQRAIMDTEEVKQKVRSLKSDAEFIKGQREMEGIQKEGQALVDKLRKDGATMSKGQREKLEKQIREKQSEGEATARKLQAKQQDMLKATVEAKQAAMQRVVNAIIKKEDIGLLLNAQAAVYADATYDITAKVTQQLNGSN